MTACHVRTVALAAILITLAPGVWVHARQELTLAAAWIVSKETSFNTGFTFDMSGGRATY